MAGAESCMDVQLRVAAFNFLINIKYVMKCDTDVNDRWKICTTYKYEIEALQTVGWMDSG